MRTRIFLKPNYLTTWVEVDSTQDIPCSFNYQVSDIREPEKRQQSYSKTVKIPGSKANNKLFTEIWHIDWSNQGAPQFNPLLKSDCEVMVDEQRVFKGYMQLTKITREQDKFINYEVLILGQVPNLFSEIGDRKLHELDFSDLNHNYTRANVEASWTPTLGTGYVYPMIVTDQTNNSTFTLSDFVPAIFAKEYLDRIFAEAGFTYNSNFFNSSYFKKLIIPFGGKDFVYTSADIQERTFRASQSGNYDKTIKSGYTDIAVNYVVPFDDDSTSPNYDTGGNYNTSSFRFNPQYSGKYKISAYIKYCVRLTPVNTTTISGDYLVSGEIEIVKNGTTVLHTQALNIPNTYTTTSIPGGTTTTVNSWSGAPGYIDLPNVDLVVGDYIDIRVVTDIVGTGVTLVTEFDNPDPGDLVQLRTLPDTTFFVNLQDNIISPGDLISMDAAVPYNFKQRDFLMALINMFNLQVDVDPYNEKELIIEPFTEYYETANPLDWSQKLDVSKALEIVPVGNLDFRSLMFTYKKDEDYYNKKYTLQTGLVYGQKLKEVVNDFSKENKKIEIPFAPTPLVNDDLSERITPQIFAFDEQSNAVTRRANLPRILFWGGLLDCQSWTLTASVSDVGTYTQYPYAGHLDNPYSPNFDLCFDAPLKVFYEYNSFIPNGDLEYTDNNLYNKFYKQYIDEISDIESKIVTGYFRLTPRDIQFINFRKLYFFEGAYFRLQKIIDYNPLSENVTRCEFVKVKKGIPFQFTKDVIIGGDLSFIGDIRTPNTGGGGKPIGGVMIPGKFVVIGMNNDVPTGTEKSFVGGDNNSIHGGCNNINIHGNGNTIYYASSGVSLFNSSGCVLLGRHADITLINCHDVTVANGISGVTAIGVESITITESGVYIGQGTAIVNTPISLTIDCDNPTNFSGGIVYVPSGSEYVNEIILTSASSSLTVTRIQGPPLCDFTIKKGGSITTLSFTGSGLIILPSPCTTALLDGTANDYITFRRISSTVVKQIDIGLY